MNIDKEKIIKALVLILGIIILATILSKILFKSGETLDVYAEKNPDVAYATPIPTPTDEPTPTPTPTEEPTPAPEPSKVSNSNGTPLLSNGATIEGRYEYSDGFYCEAISDSLAEGYDQEKQMYLHVMYYDNDGNVKDGELICDATCAKDMLETFKGFYNTKFAIEKVRLLNDYDFDEEAAILDNNTFIRGDELLLNPGITVVSDSLKDTE